MASYSMESTHNSCYPDTTVLINKFGIKDQEELSKAESYIVTAYSASIESDLRFENVTFDFYKKIHKTLFGELYDWAGKTRNINISKKGTVFCDFESIESIGTAKFNRLKSMNYLKNLNRSDFVDEITELYNDLNMLHPFREGNGRTLKLFITLLIRNAGYDINFSDCDGDFLMIATIQAAQGSLTQLNSFFSQIIK